MSSSTVSIDRRAAAESASAESQPVSQRSYAREDFEFGSLLGIGALAQVVHVRDSYTGEEYALKILDKKQLRRFGKVGQIVNEKDMLSKIDHPGIVKLHFTFQDSTWLYLALELCPNGELSELINRKGRLPLGLAQFYAGEMVNMLTYLRNIGVAHRDIKPENLFITETGHLKLGDFDTAKVVMSGNHHHQHESVKNNSKNERMNTFVGTAQYVSPEMLHDSAVAGFGSDLWALGCVVFQMLTGLPPFKSNSEYITFQKILATDYSFPDNVPAVGQAFVRALLTLDPQDRLGFWHISDLKNHEFLESLDLDTLMEQEPPLSGVLRLRKRRIRMTSEDANHLLADSSDEEDLVASCSSSDDEDFGFNEKIAPSSPILVRCATTAPVSAEMDAMRRYSEGSSSSCRSESLHRAPNELSAAGLLLHKGRSRSMSHLQPWVDDASSGAGSEGHQITPQNQAASKSMWNSSSRILPSKPSVIVESLMARQALEADDSTPEARILPDTEPLESSGVGTPGKTGMALTSYLQRICASDEHILMSGSVLKRRFFGKNRILVVTDLPRLIVLESRSFRTVCEIPLLTTANLLAYSESASVPPTSPTQASGGLVVSFVSPYEFSIESDISIWRGEVIDGTAQAWVALIQAMKQKAIKVSNARPSRSLILNSSTTRDILSREQFGSVEAMGAIFTKSAFSSDLPTHDELEAKAEARVEAALRKLSEFPPENVDHGSLINALAKQISTKSEQPATDQQNKTEIDDVFSHSARKRENSTSCTIM